MLDIKFIRDHQDLVAAAAKKKHVDFDVRELIEADDRRKELLQSVEGKRERQNAASLAIVAEKDPSKRTSLITDMQRLKTELAKDEDKLAAAMKTWQLLMLRAPNVPDMSVPDGVDDSGNMEVRVWGKKPEFNFTPKSHDELLKLNDMADLERGVKVAGFRGYFLKNDGALLNFAIWNFVIDRFRKKDFIPIIAPSVIKREVFMGTGYIPQGEDDLYKTQDGAYLAGTSEVPAMGYYMDEVLEEKQLPVKFFAFSPCYRREAGSHGKDTKGVFRIHEFFKFEQVVMCAASHEESVRLHEELTANSEALLQELELPYHVVVNCGGDLGLGQVKKYDIEAWVPSENRYRETHSSSYFHDFQTRRLNIRYKDKEGKMRFAHSLNNTALATPRILVSILENNQNADGSIRVPKVLQPYLGKDLIRK
ncbi:MAG: serine--tRNA ligase [Patescibacteria group bacterium]